MTSKYLLVAAGAVLALVDAAHALSWERGKYSADVSGYGTAGVINADDKKPDFLGDWRIRTQAAYGERQNKFGAVFATDAESFDEAQYIDDLFAFWQNSTFGRIELGMTESAAGKLGLGLPDVGAMRVNDEPLFYKKIYPHGAVISDTELDSGDQSLRLNYVTNRIDNAQYGLSVASFGDGFDYAVDAGVKIRSPRGKTKTAFSLGASFMENLNNFHADCYSPHVTADWRGQIATGLNVQYNSWLVGLTARAIYDSGAIGVATDGIAAGAGISYDFLKYSVSASYLMSATGIWHDDDKRYVDNTVLASFRYKYSANIDGWTSLGVSTKTPFVAAGLRLTF